MVLITGGTSTLGTALVKIFLENGYSVILGYYKHLDIAEKVKSEYKDNLILEYIDITDEDCVKNIFNKYDIDILINNAAKTLDNYIENKSFLEFMDVVKVNLGRTYLMCKYAKDAKYIINISFVFI